MNRVGTIMAGVVLLLLPFFVNPWGATQELQLQAPKLFAAFLLGNFALSLVFSREIHWLIGLIHILYAISCVVTGFGPMQLYPFAYWSAGAIFSLWFVRLPPCSRGYLWWTVIAGAVASCLFACLQIAGMDPVFNYEPGIDKTLPIAFFGQQTKFGAYLAPLAALALPFPGGWICFLFLGSVAMTTGSSFTIAALLAGFLVGIRWLRLVGPRLIFSGFVSVVILAIVLCYFFPQKELFYAHGRYEIWAATWNAWAHSPNRFWFGFGPGSFGQIFGPAFQPENTWSHGVFLQSHNDYLQLIFECGAIGIAIIVAGLYSLAVAFYRRWWIGGDVPREVRACQAYLVAILVNAIGNFPLQQSPHYFFAVLALAIVLKDDREAATIYEWPPQTYSP